VIKQSMNAATDCMSLLALLCPFMHSAVAQPPATLLMQESNSRPAVIRVIHDPHTGAYWLLERALDHPGGPGRMIPATQEQLKSIRAVDAQKPNQKACVMAGPPVIRAGDRIVVEESSAIVEARLAATALGPAIAGAQFKVRLAIGGKVLRATALAPGRARLMGDQGIRQ
jgi:hypothetical protein